MNDDVLESVTTFARQFGIDPDLVRAIVEHESNGECFKPRYEPAWRHLYEPRTFSVLRGISMQTEVALQSMSWGPMQVMGSVARELGFRGDLPELCSLSKGLTYGCMKLRALLDRYTEVQAISAYNQGSPRKSVGGLYMNSSGYVDPICARLRELRALI